MTYRKAKENIMIVIMKMKMKSNNEMKILM